MDSSASRTAARGCFFCASVRYGQAMPCQQEEALATLCSHPGFGDDGLLDGVDFRSDILPKLQSLPVRAHSSPPIEERRSGMAVVLGFARTYMAASGARASRLLHRLRSAENYFDHAVWLREHRHVTRIEFGRLGFHAFRKKTF